MQYNTILQKEKEIKTLKRSLKRLKEDSVTVNLIGENSHQFVNSFITMNFDHLIYEENHDNGVHTLILKARAYDIYRAIKLAAKHVEVHPDITAAYIQIADDIHNSKGNTLHQLL